jgi:hypothetical protein
MSAENTESKTRKPHRWKPGQSGNPAGKPVGARHKATRLVQEMMGDEAKAVIRKVIDKALEGDATCLRLCLERMSPAIKENPITLQLPDIQNAEDAVKAMCVVVSNVVSGEITPSEGSALSGIVETYRRTLETQDLEKRISELETANEKSK